MASFCRRSEGTSGKVGNLAEYESGIKQLRLCFMVLIGQIVMV